MVKKIDFVLLWVDGNDPKWINEKIKYSPNKSVDDTIKRYRDWDNLQYWFRGVEKFAPWVNKIHFVTCGHYPEWLNTKHPKLNLVKHSDYMPQEYIPTFSSHPIELNLHRIDGLSEQFVYFNDDMFIINHVKPTNFFIKGLPCDSAVMRHIPTYNDNIFNHILLNTVGAINDIFSMKSVIFKDMSKWINFHYDIKSNLRNLAFIGLSNRFPSFVDNHLPSAYLKSSLENTWDKLEKHLDETSKRKFRDIRDVNQYIFRYWQFCTGKFHPINMKKYGMRFRLPNDKQNLFNAIDNQTYNMICANDNDDNMDFEKVAEELRTHFNNILPEKSKFEI